MGVDFAWSSRLHGVCDGVFRSLIGRLLEPLGKLADRAEVACQSGPRKPAAVKSIVLGVRRQCKKMLVDLPGSRFVAGGSTEVESNWGWRLRRTGMTASGFECERFYRRRQPSVTHPRFAVPKAQWMIVGITQDCLLRHPVENQPRIPPFRDNDFVAVFADRLAG